jgi:small GTP-binding protein
MPTIGVEYKQKIIEVDDRSLIKVQIWDTAGTERFRTITPVYYRNVDGVLLVYDITDKESFDTINYWVEELNGKADIASIELMLVGNKNDLEDNRRVSREEAQDVATKIGIPYCEASAKSFESTEKAFNKLINNILKRHKK